jgi:hypothetical protein
MAIVAANYAFVYRLSASHGELRLKKYFGVPPVTFQVGSIDRVAVGVRGRGRMLGTVCFLAGDRHLQIQPRTWETAPLTALLADLREQGVEVDDGVWDVVNPGAAPPPE